VNNPVTGYALRTVWLVDVLASSDAILHRHSVDDTRAVSVADGRTQLGLRTASFTGTWIRADDNIGGPEYGGIGVASQ
jgi:hypothetical protein